MPTTAVVADDRAISRRVMRDLLENEGFEVATHASTIAAEADVERRAIDLVVTDIVLPERDGIELIRSLARRQNRPILAAYSRGDSDYVDAARLLGADIAVDLNHTEGRHHLVQFVRAAARNVRENG